MTIVVHLPERHIDRRTETSHHALDIEATVHHIEELAHHRRIQTITSLLPADVALGVPLTQVEEEAATEDDHDLHHQEPFHHAEMSAPGHLHQE